MDKRVVIGAGIVVLVILGAGGVLRFAGERPPAADDAGAGEATRDSGAEFYRALDISLKDYAGNTVALSDFSGRVRVVNAWATWCPFCVDELPDFVALQEEFQDEIVVIAIDRAEPKAQAKKFTERLGVTDELVFLLDPQDSFYHAIGGFAMPETLFIDEAGNIRVHKRGPMELEEMTEMVKQVLAAS